MTFYFATKTLIGAIDNKEALLYYGQLVKWCRLNLQAAEWQLDLADPLSYQNCLVARGIILYGITAAVLFADV